MHDSPKDITTDLGLLSLAAIWGINFSVVKIVLEELDPLALNALRFPLAVAALAFLARGRSGPRWPSKGDLPRIVLLGLLGNVAYQMLFIFGIDWTEAGNASLLLSTTPAWTVLFSAWAGHERATPGVMGGVAVTLVGICLVVLGRGDAIGLGLSTLRGDLMMIAASILWSIYTVAGREPVACYGALRTTAWTVYVGTPFLVLAGVPSVLRTDLGAVSSGAWLGITYAGFLSIGLAYLLWYRGVQHLGNSRTAIYSNLVPVAALVTAWLWLGEVPTPLQLVGASVILVGLTIARLSQSPGPSALGRSLAPRSAR